VFNARTDRGSGFRGATSNPYLWGALAITVGLEAIALGIVPLRDLLGLTVLSPTAWAVALSLATVPLVLTQTVRVWRDRGTAADGDHRSGTRAGS
jgi:P-type Ca2+ transporter type 2C